jgi:hypothetical protein
MQWRGRVVRRLHGRGSKSEHEALVLETDRGTFRLRRPDGNAFRDPLLETLEGHEVVCEGTLEGTTLLIDAWKFMD